MLELIERHNQALSLARMFHRPLSIIKFADTGMRFEKAYTSYAHLLPVEENTAPGYEMAFGRI